MAHGRMRSCGIGIITTMLVILHGCDNAGSVPSQVTVTIKIESFALDVAADSASRERGLGGRESIPADGGMLFIFPRAEHQRFWMRDCLSDIDVIFLDGRGFITAMHRMKAEPPRRPSESETAYLERLVGYESKFPAQFAIELAPGSLDRLGLRFQDKIDLDVDRLKKMAR